ncbi:hypothetical protein AT746_16720 [Lacimicrobium alkaliphilum]|uniref:Amidase domain-containing protein n=1 Tax=Lacimicrobium alkaliphilum TaxID=1526571 RepID=A0A0U2ZA01_9ALTE|nr:hypothetical protein AT746_16720 [Lacimicrobium alkaliphilum]
MQPYQLSVTELLNSMREKQLSPLELMRSYQQRIRDVNPSVNAFAFQFPEQALAQAKAAEQLYQRGDYQPLSGLAAAIKDETYIKGQITTNGSYCLADAVATTTDPVPQALMDNGAIVHGRTTTPECSTAAVTWSDIWGVSRNPWNTAITCGVHQAGRQSRWPRAWQVLPMAPILADRCVFLRLFVVCLVTNHPMARSLRLRLLISIPIAITVC